jgi:hypothetical protein
MHDNATLWEGEADSEEDALSIFAESGTIGREEYEQAIDREITDEEYNNLSDEEFVGGIYGDYLIEEVVEDGGAK